MSASKVAIFVDFEDLASAAQAGSGELDLGAVMHEAEAQGACVLRRAYADWTRHKRHSEMLAEHAFELTQRFADGGRRRAAGTADIQLVVDALEAGLSLPDIDRFVIVGHSVDYAALVRRLRARGKSVTVIGLGAATSPLLVQACDRFQRYESLDLGSADAATGGIGAARDLLASALRRKLGDAGEEGLLAATLKHAMLSMDPSFDEVALGYPQFKDFLTAQSDLVESRVVDQQLWVRARGESELESDAAADYRRALRSADLRAFEGRGEERVEVLRDLYQLLVDFPAEFSLPDCVVELVARYDAEGVARDRNLVRDIVKLLRFTDLCEPEPESYQFDPLSLATDVDEASFVDHCESVYLSVFLESRLPIASEVVAQLLFGSPEEVERVDDLAELAAELLEVQGMPVGEAWEWPEHFLEQPELAAIIGEVEACQLDEAPGVARAAALSERGHAVRPKSFEQARQHFLQAARMTVDLLRGGEPGASQIDLETYLASYCFAAAGAHYLGYEYARASQYYLAFFTLIDETRPVWDKMYGLVPPMMSYYFSTVLRALREPVSASPGFTHPAIMAITLHEHANPEARERWLELLGDLRRVNPTVLRLVADRLSQLEADKGQEGAAETRQALAEVA
ncbi:MAG: NYN domain-containing protein [Chloroflexi bacterium]|nr:NYN domain-containing protein [Chloroflexota bacterium]